jgi:hypothetical protein
MTELRCLAADGTIKTVGPDTPLPVGTPGDRITVTPVLDTNAYADGDVMGSTTTVASAVRVTGGRCVLQSVTVVDEDDQGTAFDLLFFGVTQSLGTDNSAPNISDANARDFQGHVSILAGDFIDLGGVRVATKTGIGLVLEATTRDLFLGLISRGAPTRTASGLKISLGLLWD